MVLEMMGFRASDTGRQFSFKYKLVLSSEGYNQKKKYFATKFKFN